MHIPGRSLRFPRLDFRLPHVDFRLPHVDVRLPHLELHLPNWQDLPKHLGEPVPHPGGRVPRWWVYMTGALAILAFAAGFRNLDQTLSIWFADTRERPGEATEWFTKYADLVPGVPDALPEAGAGAGAPNLALAGLTPETRRATPAHIPPAPLADHRRFVRVDVTAYTSTGAQTDADPGLTASNTRTNVHTVALSRDLLKEFSPGAPFRFGDKILIPGVGIYRVEDTMHPRWKKKIDLWFSSADEARLWGNRIAYVTRIGGDAPPMAYEFR